MAVTVEETKDESAARSSMVVVLVTGVVDATAMLVGREESVLLVDVAVAEEGRRVKERRAAQVAGSSPCFPVLDDIL